MTDVFGIALTGLTASKQRLSVAASNIANVSSAGALPDANGQVPAGSRQAYRPLRSVETPVIIGRGEGAGVKSTVVETPDPYIPTYSPDSIDANAEGLIAVPNIDLARESVELLIAKATFKANAAVIETASEMEKDLIDRLV